MCSLWPETKMENHSNCRGQVSTCMDVLISCCSLKKKLGKSRQKDSAVTSIQLIQTPVIPGTKCIEQWYSKTLECESSCMDGPHTSFL